MSEFEENAQVDEKPVRSRKRAATLVSLCVLWLVLLGVLTNWLISPVPYYALGPGPTSPVSGLAEISEAKSYDHKGQIYYTTVTEYGEKIRRFQYFWFNWFDKDYELRPIHELDTFTGGITCYSPDEFANEQMSVSQQIAVSVALRRLDKPVELSSEGAQVVEIVPGTPAQGKFQLCDSIISVDGTKVETPSEARNIVLSHKPGDLLKVVVRSYQDDKVRTITIRAGESEDDRAQLGIRMTATKLVVNSPIKIKYEKTDVGGPSAGLAFALDLIDSLSPGELTGGKQIAVTGSLDLDGKVQAIGGIREKAISVSDKGIKIFIVPRRNLAEAKKGASKGLKLIPVDDLEGAIQALAKEGGDISSLPPAPDLSEI